MLTPFRTSDPQNDVPDGGREPVRMGGSTGKLETRLWSGSASVRGCLDTSAGQGNGGSLVDTKSRHARGHTREVVNIPHMG